MSVDETSLGPGLPPSMAQRLDRIRDDYDATWRAGQRPRLEEYIQGCEPLARPILLRELVSTDLEHRQRAGEEPTLEEYQGRFPDDLEAIRSAFFGQVAVPSTAPGPRSTLVSGRPEAFRLRCPHCHHRVEVVELGTSEEIVCGSCEATFHVASGRPPRGTLAIKPGVRQFGRFELREILGTGAFGTVWRARDPRLDRLVALKIPRAGHFGTEAERDRFVREARAAAQLRHDSIVAIHDVGDWEGQPYIVSDLVEGVDLARWLAASSPTFLEAAEWIAGVAGALQYAHDQGVIHRDIKPSNLMLDDRGRLHVMDFGLAKRDAGEITMTLEGQILGTPAYMAPEQVETAHQVDGRADVYALGVILYQLLTGELPFRGTTPMVLHQVRNDEPRALGSSTTGSPPTSRRSASRPWPRSPSVATPPRAT